jgi:5-methylcytosine-specific restriction endonuclease McrA
MRKETRIEVWNKYDNKCAYCGKDLEYKEMQVDHIWPQFLKHWLKTSGMLQKYNKDYPFDLEKLEDVNDIINLFPACRSCNYDKRSQNIGEWKESVKDKIRILRKGFNFKFMERYEIINVYEDKEVKFYYETESK